MAVLFILNAYALGYANNSESHPVRVRVLYGAFILLHLIINSYSYSKFRINYKVVSSVIITGIYLALYPLLGP